MSVPVEWAKSPVWQGFKWTPSDTAAHSGIDLGMPPGTPITAPMNGTIISAGNEPWGGQVNEQVEINGQPYVLTWIHLSKIQAQPGQQVQAGQQIGLSGTPPKGYGSGSHTHFEITHGSVPPYMGYNPHDPTPDNYPVNPANFVSLAKEGLLPSGGPIGAAAASALGGGFQPAPWVELLIRAGIIMAGVLFIVIAVVVFMQGNHTVQNIEGGVSAKTQQAAEVAAAV